MIKKTFNKLIRDKVARNLAARNISTVTKMLKDQEMPAALEEKLQEEFQEFWAAAGEDKLKEAVDILTVTRDWLRRHGLEEDRNSREATASLNSSSLVEELADHVLNLHLSKPKAKRREMIAITNLVFQWAESKGYSAREVEVAYSKKLASHGGFKLNVFLFETTESKLKPRIS